MYGDVLNLRTGGSSHSPGPRVGASLSALSALGGGDGRTVLLFGGATFNQTAALANDNAVTTGAQPPRPISLVQRLPLTLGWHGNVATGVLVWAVEHCWTWVAVGKGSGQQGAGSTFPTLAAVILDGGFGRLWQIVAASPQCLAKRLPLTLLARKR